MPLSPARGLESRRLCSVVTVQAPATAWGKRARSQRPRRADSTGAGWWGVLVGAVMAASLARYLQLLFAGISAALISHLNKRGGLSFHAAHRKTRLDASS